MPNAQFNWIVPAEHPAFAGHFPGNPIVPGVVLLDRAILFAEELIGKSGLNWQVGNAKFFSPVRPEEALTFVLEAKPSGSISFVIRGTERDIASGSLKPPTT